MIGKYLVGSGTVKDFKKKALPLHGVARISHKNYEFLFKFK